jgi:hypothetical protein
MSKIIKLTKKSLGIYEMPQSTDITKLSTKLSKSQIEKIRIDLGLDKNTPANEVLEKYIVSKM